MVGTRFELVKLYACDLESHPFDRSGNLPHLYKFAMFLSSFVKKKLLVLEIFFEKDVLSKNRIYKKFNPSSLLMHLPIPSYVPDISVPPFESNDSRVLMKSILPF